MVAFSERRRTEYNGGDKVRGVLGAVAGLTRCQVTAPEGSDSSADDAHCVSSRTNGTLSK